MRAGRSFISQPCPSSVSHAAAYASQASETVDTMSVFVLVSKMPAPRKQAPYLSWSHVIPGIYRGVWLKLGTQ